MLTKEGVKFNSEEQTLLISLLLLVSRLWDSAKYEHTGVLTLLKYQDQITELNSPNNRKILEELLAKV